MHLCVKMEAAIYHKFKQHKDLMRELLATGNAELIEVRRRARSRIFSSNCSGLTDPCRTQTKTHFGAVGRTEKEGMSWGKLSNVFVITCVKKSDDNGNLHIRVVRPERVQLAVTPTVLLFTPSTHPSSVRFAMPSSVRWYRCRKYPIVDQSFLDESANCAPGL